MAEWQTLIGSTIQADIDRKRANPGVANFGELVRTAMALNIKKAEETRKGAADTAQAASTAIFNKFPQAAAAASGIPIPTTTPGQIPQGPPGTVLDKVQYDEAGNPTTVYINPANNVPTPSFSQEQEIAATRSALMGGSYSLKSDWTGTLSPGKIKTMGDALAFITYKGLDPQMFQQELAIYDVIEQGAQKKGPYKGRTIQHLGMGVLFSQIQRKK
jgi:hypothetical protein